MEPKNLILAAVAGLFAIWLLARMAIPAMSGTRRQVPGIREALARVQSAEGDKAKSAALLAAGDLLAKSGGNVTAATAYFLRAMRLDPASLEPLERLVVLLRSRPSALDRVLWKRLASLPWEGETRKGAARAAELLSGRTMRRRAERQVLAKLAATLRG